MPSNGDPQLDSKDLADVVLALEKPHEDDGRAEGQGGGAAAGASSVAGNEHPGEGSAAHDVKVIRGLGYDDVDRGARDLNDPEQMRYWSGFVGRRLHAWSAVFLFGTQGLVRKMYEALGAIRKGASARQAIALGTSLRETIATAQAKMSLLAAEGVAALAQAEDIEARALSEARQERDEAKDKYQAAVAREEEAERGVDTAVGFLPPSPVDMPEENEPFTSGTAPRSRSVWERIALPPESLVLLLPLEFTATTVALHQTLAKVVIASSGFETWVTAGAASAGLLGLGAVAGFAGAALRLSGRVMALVVLALTALILVKSGAAMTELRLGLKHGIGLLSWTTFATVLIGGVTVFSVTTYKLAEREKAGYPDERDNLNRIGVEYEPGHPLNVPVRVLNRAKKQVVEAMALFDQKQQVLDGLTGEIARLRQFHRQTLERMLKVLQDALAAGVRYQDLMSDLAVTLRQEDANVLACVANAELAHGVIRAEESSETDTTEVKPPEPLKSSPEAPRADRAAILAAISLGLGSVVGVVVPSMPAFVLGALGAAAIWFLTRRRRGGGGSASPATEEHDPRRPSIAPTADTSSKTYFQQPSETYSPWTDGDTDPTRNL